MLSTTIHPKDKGYVTYLGVRIDTQLKWNQQAELARTKAAKSIEAIRRIAGSV